MTPSTTDFKDLLPGFSILDTIYESDRSAVYRGQQREDDKPVIIKRLRDSYAHPREIGRFRLEHTLIKKLALDGVIDVLDYRSHKGRHAIILEDFGAESLDRHLRAGTWQPPHTVAWLTTFLRVAERLADTLTRVHSASVIHKDIKPHNIVFNPETGVVKIVDFGIASLIAVETAELVNPNLMEGSLSYMSPEQTGRMNRTVDCRSDLYSLGVTFYELLTGELPFTSQDPLELVHCHIARVPVPVHQKNQDIPFAVSDIVAKLLSKAPEDRYQGAYGLKHDLSACLHQLETTGRVEGFPLGKEDTSVVFQVASKLYGRQPQIDALLGCFAEVASGLTGSHVALVSGYSGIGKSSIVNEIHKPLTQQRGYFISGKFDQFKRSVPYASFLQAFQSLVRQILSEPEESIARWRANLLAAIKSNGRVLVDVIPEIESIIGPQPPVEPLGAVENQNRFNKTFRDFCAVFCQKEHPLVIFLDDLQWADVPTLGLIELLVTDPSIRYLFFIGAYRDNEVDEKHPLTKTLASIDAARPCQRIQLGALDIDHVNQLVTDSLMCSEERALPLTKHVYAKTNGNPFFLKMFLGTIYRDGHLHFDVDRGEWAFDLEKIEAMGITENVVELVVDRLRRFSPETQGALALAAYIGNEFSLRLPAMASQIDLQSLGKLLWPAIEEGMLIPLDDEYKWMAHVEGGAPNARFRFLHDRAQQAAYALIDADKSAALHLRLGRLLLERMTENELKEHIFDVVNHLNRGRELITDPQERSKVAALNLAVARRAKASSAYEPAMSYVEAGLGFLPDDAWQSSYDLAFGLHLEKGEVESLLARWEPSIATLREMLTHLDKRLDRARVLALAQTSYRMSNDLSKALGIGVEALAEFGVHLDPHMSMEAVGEEIKAVYARFINGWNIEAYFDLPPMDDPEQLAILELLVNCTPPAYFLGSPLLFCIPIRMLEITVRHGNSPLASLGHIFLSSLTLAAAAQDYPTARRFGHLGLRLHDEKYPVKAFESTMLIMWGAFVSHYTENLNVAREHLLRGYYSGVEQGAYQWASYCAQNRLYMNFYGVLNLAQVSEEIARIAPALAQVDPIGVRYYHCTRAIITSLVEGAASRYAFSEEDWPDSQAALDECRERNDLTTLFVVATERLSLANWFSDSASALAFGEAAAKCVGSAPGIYMNPVYHLHHALAYARGCDDASPERKAEYIAAAEKMAGLFAFWSKTAPTTYEHQLFMIQAELSRVQGRTMEAAELYDRAIAGADTNGFLAHEAFANELAGRFYLDKGRKKLARAYLAEACELYWRWGASAKVADMQARFAEFLPPSVMALGSIEAGGPQHTATNQRQTTHERQTANHRPTIGQRSTTIHRSGSGSSESSLDMMTVIKASQVLSEEVVLTRLLDKLMNIVLENAGAQTGVLLMASGQGLAVRAVGVVEGDETIVTGPETQSVPVAMSVAQYVARTGESVVLHDASRDGMFSSDPSIEGRKARSVLCVPLVRQGRTTAVVYLENPLVAGAFTPGRVETLKVLAGQIAISLENALLYEDMEQRVRDRTRELNARSEAMRLVLDNVDQGLVTIGKDLTLSSEKSAAFVRHFGAGDEGRDFALALCPDDERARLSLRGSFEQLVDDFLPIELSLMQMPSQLKRGDSTYHLGFKPILVDDVLDGVLLMVTDVTVQERARAAEAIQREQLRTFERLMRDRASFVEFFAEARRLVERIRDDAFESNEERMRTVHTLKGNVALFDVTSVSQAAHDLEQARSEGEDEACATAKKALLDAWDGYAGRAVSLLGEDMAERVELSEADFESILGGIRRKMPHEQLEEAFVRLRHEPAQLRLSRIANQISTLSRNLGKGEPIIKVSGDDLRFPPGSWRGFWSGFAHVVRNTVDHGFQNPEDRVSSGKPEANQVELLMRVIDDQVVVEIADDGNGIKWDRLREKAEARGLPTATRDDLVAALFASGISTAEEITSTSGRGVGMAEVAHACKAIGGRIEVESERGKGTRFRFLLPLPSTAGKEARNTDSSRTPPLDGRSLAASSPPSREVA